MANISSSKITLIATIIAQTVVLILLLTACGADGGGNMADIDPPHLDAYYLDTHVHSLRSGDFGAHGTDPTVNGSLPSIEAYAILNGIDWVWLTDHEENQPEPFRATSVLNSGIEYCAVAPCYNETKLTPSTPFRVLTHPYEIGDMDVRDFHGIEVLTTGGAPDQYRVGISEGIAMIQQGGRPVFLGSSNSHAGLAGRGALTAISKQGGADRESALYIGRTTALRDKRYTMFLTYAARLARTTTYTPPLFPLPASAQTVVTEVYSDGTLQYSINGNEKQNLAMSSEALAVFISIQVGSNVVAVTSPAY